jgi:hypothetical protein
VRIAELATAEDETGSYISDDNLTLFFHPPLHIAVAHRPTRDAAFGTPQLVDHVNSAISTDDDAEPYLTQQDQVIYFPSNRKGGAGGFDLWRSARNADGSFATPVAVTELNTTGHEDAPTPSADGLTMYWDVDGADGVYHIWTASRASTAVAFTNPQLNKELSSASHDQPGWISSDNCVFYFASDRVGGAGNLDIWIARRPL